MCQIAIACELYIAFKDITMKPYLRWMNEWVERANCNCLHVYCLYWIKRLFMAIKKKEDKY